jgi:hypothetical protein
MENTDEKAKFLGRISEFFLRYRWLGLLFPQASFCSSENPPSAVKGVLQPWPVRVLALLIACASLTSAAARAGENEDGSVLITVRLTHPVELVRGRASVISLAIALSPGVRLLEDGPLVLSLDGRALTPLHRTLRRRDAVDPRAELPRFEIEVRAEHTGAPELNAKLAAWVCRGPRCRPVELDVLLPLALAETDGPRRP